MKKKIPLLSLCLCTFALLTAGCQREPSPAPASTPTPPPAVSTPTPTPDVHAAGAMTVEVSNLNDTRSRQELDHLMEDAGISADRRALFFRHVDLFNSLMDPTLLTDGYELQIVGEPKYDPYALVDLWDTAHPDYPGYNCRLTAFGLLGDLIEAPAPSAPQWEMLEFDQLTLQQQGDAALLPVDQDRFPALYAAVPTEPTQEISVHLKNLQKAWTDRGVVFDDRSEVRLISVVLHNAWDGNDRLFVGHAGVLFPTDDGLYFVEKLAFQEPYQCVKFADRAQLAAYLTLKYDVDQGQPTAAPFFLENDQLMSV